MSKIRTPITNITRTMVVVMSMETVSPSTSKDGRRSGKGPNITIAATPDRKTSAEVRPCFVYVRAVDAGAAPPEPVAAPVEPTGTGAVPPEPEPTLVDPSGATDAAGAPGGAR